MASWVFIEGSLCFKVSGVVADIFSIMLDMGCKEYVGYKVLYGCIEIQVDQDMIIPSYLLGQVECNIICLGFMQAI